MSEKSFKPIKSKLRECNKLPERVKEIILNKVNKSLNDLDEDDSKQLWILLFEFIKETSVLEDAVDNTELFVSYQFIVILTQHAINCVEDVLSVYNEDGYLLKTIMILQSLYSKKFKNKFKIEIAKMCSCFWKLLAASTQNKPELTTCFDTIMIQNFIFTFDYLFETIKVTIKKVEMKVVATLLYELCKSVSQLSSNQNIMNIVMPNLEKNMKNTLFLETKEGKLTFADLFTTNQQLFLKFHQTVKQLLPKVNKLEATAYGEIYFLGWINSNSAMREVIEQQGIFDIISKTFTLQRTGLTFRTYKNASIFLQSVQNHRKHLIFSKVITNLYAPVLWRQLRSEVNVVRCNATEILARAYPLEKRGEGPVNSSRFLIKQQDAFLDQLDDSCPKVRIAAIEGICSCMRYFWISFEDHQIIKYFNLFMRLINESVFEVRRIVYFGFCQLLDERRSHIYFKNNAFLAKIKNTLNDDNEKVRRAFFHFLLKIKKIDSQMNDDKINFVKIVNLHDIAKALANEDRQNALLLVELIFDNFIGENITDKNVTLTRLFMFYKICPVACRNLMFYSEKVLDFNSACELILTLLKTLYFAIVKKQTRLKAKDKENVQNDNSKNKQKSVDGSAILSDTSSSSCNSSNSEDDNDQSRVCCILNCVHALMILHRDKLRNENNSQQLKDVQDSCTKCLIIILKFYKEGDVYFCAMSLASLIPVSKLTPHVSVPSSVLSTLKQLPPDVRHAEEEIDVHKVNCLVYTMCKWKRGYEILQLVYVWFDEAFKSLNLNDTQYPECKKRKIVRFKSEVEECKPMTGILLINIMLKNSETQEYLFNSDTNKRNIFDLIIYLKRVMPAIENRISSDNVISNLLSDELLVDLLDLNMKLSILYHSQDKDTGVDEIIKYQTSILDWVLNNVLSFDLHLTNESTIAFAVKTINVVNYIVMQMCLMEFVNTKFLNNFFTFCATLLNNYLGLRVLISMIETLAKISKYLHYLKLADKYENTPLLTSCICSIVSVLGESKIDENLFKSIIGEPKKFRYELTMVILKIFEISIVEFKHIFMVLIKTIMNIIADKIREINEVDLNEQLTEVSFVVHVITTVILSCTKLRKHFLSSIVGIFSSDVYKNDPVLLLSAISFIYTLSFQSSHLKGTDLEPVVQLLYRTLMEHDKTTAPLGNNCTVINNTNMDQQVSVLEVSDFENGITDFKQKGRYILVATAKQLHITLS